MTYIHWCQYYLLNYTGVQVYMKTNLLSGGFGLKYDEQFEQAIY